MGILNILYPERCPVCHKVLRGRGRVCPGCVRKLPYVKEPKCKKCGKEIEKQEEEYCRDCRRYAHAFDKGAAVFVYDDVMRHSIAMFKYHNRREYGKFYAVEMKEHCDWFLKQVRPDVIVPIPLHKGKKRKRGYNQAEIVAKELGKLLNVPVDCDCLVRVEKTTPQKELTRRQRKENLKKAFAAGSTKKCYERMLLIDDIYTTGATMDAVCEILKEKNAKNLFFLTICVGRND
jgi:ComF family protein